MGATKEITAEELKRRMDAGEVFVLDVREPREWETARIEGATLIPMRQVPERLEEVPRERPVVCMCHHGGRSAAVQGFLMQQGYEDVWNLTGGIEAWSLTVDPQVPRY